MCNDRARRAGFRSRTDGPARGRWKLTDAEAERRRAASGTPHTELCGVASVSLRHVTGHVCPACSEAVERAGAVGWTARSPAVLAHVRSAVGERRADRFRALLADDFPPTLPACGR